MPFPLSATFGGGVRENSEDPELNKFVANCSKGAGTFTTESDCARDSFSPSVAALVKAGILFGIHNHNIPRCDNHDLSRFNNQSIERDRLIEIGFVLDFVKFISFTFSDKEMILVIEAVSR
ncbi:hypothetical protein Tco_0359900 [Tanacetum coccineum]